MTKDAPAFDFYPERWTHGTRHMTKLERSDYLDLLLTQWTDDGIPGDLDIVARILGYKKSAQIPSIVLVKFPLCSDGKRRNQFLEGVRESQRARIQKSRDKIAKMNAARDSTRASTRESCSAPTRPLLSDILTASSPLTTHHSPNTPNGVSPLPPEGDGEVLILEVAPVAEAKPKAWNPSSEQVRVSSWFHMRPTTVWDAGEMRAWKAIPEKHPDDLESLEAYYTATLPAGERDIRRHDLKTLLNNWNGEVIRSRKFKPAPTDDRPF